MEENKKPSNPFAFPLTDGTSFANDGMTLRDYFANSAMQATDLEAYATRFGLAYEKHVASDSYRLADAMLKQREL